MEWPVKIDDDVIYGKALLVGGDFFSVLGAAPLLGRTLQPEDDQTGAPPAVVIGYGLWQRQFGGLPSVLGRSLRTNGRHYAIVGVMPRDFDLPGGVEMWFPLSNATPAGTRPTWPYLALVGRLAPGASLATAQTELGAFLKRESQQAPDEMPNAGADVRSLAEHVVGNVKPLILVFTAASALLLVLACINVANLLMIRGAGRRQELSLRAILGADRGRLVRQLLAESLVLGLAAAVLGVILAILAVRDFLLIAPPGVARLSEIVIDIRVLAAAIVAALGAVVIFGLGPALWLSRTNLAASVQAGTQRTTDSRRLRAARRLIVIGQVALAQLVLIGAGLLVHTLLRLERIDLGFQPEGITSARVVIGVKYSDPQKYATFLDLVLPKIRAMPGVESVSPAEMRPLVGEGWRSNYEARGQPSEVISSNPTASIDAVGASFFQTLQVPLIRGRTFRDADLSSPEPIAIVSQQLARRTWQNENPVGKQMRLITSSGPDVWRTVVGVVADTRYRDLKASTPTIYLPYTQSEDAPHYLLIRSAQNITSLRGQLLASFREVENEVWLPEVATLPELLSLPLARPALDAAVLTTFAGIALLLVCAGIYGLAATFVRQRTRELGVRLALGAQPADLTRLVLREGILLAVYGVGIGALAGLVASRSLASALYEVHPTDPITFGIVMALVVLVAAIASYLPARRAARLSPSEALRTEGT